MNTKIFVGNLSHRTTTEDLRMLFGRVGSVVSVEVIKDRETGKPKGFAFIEMVSTSDTGKAVSEFNGYMLDQRKINVMAAREQSPKSRGSTSGYTEYKSYNQSVNNKSFSSRGRNSR